MAVSFAQRTDSNVTCLYVMECRICFYKIMSFVTTDTHLLDLEVPFLLEEMIVSKPFVDRHTLGYHYFLTL